MAKKAKGYTRGKLKTPNRAASAAAKGKKKTMPLAEAKARGKAASKPNGSGARSQTLPGMGRVRIQALDNLCESLSATRGKMASLRADEADDMRAALALLIKNKRTGYTHAGVEMLVTGGEQKLRVRTKKDEPATTDIEPEEGEREPVGEVEGVEESVTVGIVGLEAEGDGGDDEGNFDLP